MQQIKSEFKGLVDRVLSLANTEVSSKRWSVRSLSELETICAQAEVLLEAYILQINQPNEELAYEVFQEQYSQLLALEERMQKDDYSQRHYYSQLRLAV